jgi:antitoxin PrlF
MPQEEAMALPIYSFEEISTISSKGQTTIPKPVRQALGVGEGDQIAFHVDESGVTIRRAGEDSDPTINAFLSFLAKDLENRPGKISAFPPELAKAIAKLTAGVASDPDAPIEGDVDL